MQNILQAKFLRHGCMLLIFYLQGITLFAQQIDSLENLIRTKKLSDTERVDALNLLSRDITFANPAKSARLASEAVQTSLRINYPAGQAHGYRILASVFSNNFNSIIAAEYLERAMDIFSQLNDSAGLANCYITMGHMFRRVRHREEEVTYHKKSFEIFSRLKIPNRIAVAANNLGESYLFIKEYEKSRELTLYAIHLNDSLQNLSVLSNCYKVMAKLEVAAGNLASGEMYFQQALNLSDKLGDNSQKIATIESLIGLADIYKQTGKTDDQLLLLNKAAVFSETNLLVDYLEYIYSSFIIAHAAQKEQVINYSYAYRRALSTVNANILKNRMSISRYGEEIYDYLENETRKREKEFILQQHKLESKTFFLTLSLAAGLLFALMAIFLFRLLRKQKKAEIEINKRKGQLRGLAAHLQNIREQERTKIASEIHDELGQPLTVMKMDLSWLKDKLAAANEPAASKRAEELSNILDNAVKAVRRISTSLRPGMLDDIGIAVAMKWELSEFEKRYPVKTKLEEVDSSLVLPDPIKTGMFRIFQEAILYIGQYANANNISIQLFSEDEVLTLLIVFDGSVANVEPVNGKENLGFLSIRERCYMLNGSFHIENSSHNKNLLTIKVPIA